MVEMARRTKEDAAATRNGLIDAAERVFCEKGVSRASLSDIASAAGATRGALYFLNKLYQQGIPREAFEMTRGFLAGYGVEHRAGRGRGCCDPVGSGRLRRARRIGSAPTSATGAHR